MKPQALCRHVRQIQTLSLGYQNKHYSQPIRWLQHAPKMPETDFKPTPYKGLPYEETSRIRKDHLSPSMVPYYRQPLMVHQGHMQWLYDIQGRRYLDMWGGIVTVGVGHCHPRVVEALKEQMSLLWHTTPIYLHTKKHEYVEKLIAKLPGDLKVCYIVNSGSEANDMAMLMARLYTGNYDIISLRNAYHGMSFSTMGLTAHSTWKYPTAHMFGVHHAMNPDPYTGPWGGSRCRNSPVQTDRTCACGAGACEATAKYLDQLNQVLMYSVPKGKVAGMFAEPIQGVGGTVQYPKGYLKGAYDLIKANGGLFIADEVQTGFGRTGETFWGFQAEGIQPDIVTMAKSIGNGFPLAAVVTSAKVAQVMSQALHFNTYGGNPLASAVGSAVLDVIEEEQTQARCADVGTHFLLGLAKLRDEYEIVGDVRGKGLMIGLELVQDQRTRQPLPVPQVLDIWEATKDMGLLIGRGGLHGNVFRIKPPMCITKEDADFAVDVIRTAIHNHYKK